MPAIRTDQLAGEQAAPRERPALLQAADEATGAPREHHVAETSSSPGAEHPAGPQQDRRDVVDAVDEAVGDRRRGAEHDDEQDRGLAEPEQDDRGGNQAIDGIVCRPVIIEPIAGAQDPAARDQGAERDADRRRDREAVERAA